MKNKIKIIYLATPDIALKSLDYLYNSDCIEVSAVVTQPDRPSGRGNKIKMSPVKEFALTHNIPCYQPVSIKKDVEVQQELKKYQPDFFITFAFGQILSQEVLDIPKYETINLHASLLPKYRGANPIQRAIINGDKETGICTMITELGLDCGDICLKQKIDITDDMTCVDLWEVIAQNSPKLLEDTIKGLCDKTLKRVPQCQDGVCMANKVLKEETLIDWNKSAKEIHNLVRGIYKSPSAYFIYKDKMIKVLKTSVSEDISVNDKNTGDIIQLQKNKIVVKTGKGFINLLRVKPEGKGEMDAKDWYNGVKNAN